MTVLVYRSSSGQDQPQPPVANLANPGLAEVLVFSGFGDLAGLNPIDTVMSSYQKIKSANPISTTNINTEKVLKRVIGVSAMIGGVRDTIMAGRKKGINVEKLTAGFEQQRGAVNQSLRELQEFIKGKSGRHVKMPYLNPLGATEDVTFMGADFGLFPLAMAMTAVAGIGALVTLPVVLVKKVLATVKGAENYAAQSQKLMDDIVNDPSLSTQQKVDLAKEVQETFTPPVEPGFFDKIKTIMGFTQMAEEKMNTVRKVATGLAIAAGAWSIYRVAKGQPIIPGVAATKFGDDGYYLSGGSFMDQKNKMSSCAAKWRNSDKSGSYKGFMSRCLRGSASGLSGNLGMFGSSSPSKSKKRRGGGRKISSPAMKAMQGKMSSCAAQWQRSSKSGSYRQFISRCLKG